MKKREVNIKQIETAFKKLVAIREELIVATERAKNLSDKAVSEGSINTIDLKILWNKISGGENERTH